MKTIVGRVLLMLEQMEADGEITTTDEITKPLEFVWCKIEKAAA